MITKIIKFNTTDGIILDGYLNKCQKNTNSILIQIHGMTSNCFKNRDNIISNKVAELNIDTLCFNNRGSEIIKYCQKENGEKILQGTAYEDVEECFYDIVGAIKFVVNLGYQNVYLQGHSLGSTKIVYAYNKMLKENNKYLKITICDETKSIFNSVIRKLKTVSDIDILDVSHMSRKVIKQGTEDINIEYFYTEISLSDVDKWTAIEYLINQLNIKKEEVVAIRR